MRVNPASKSPRKPTYAAKQRRQCPPPVIQPCFLLGPLSAYRPRSTFRKNRIEIFFQIFRTKMVRSFGISKTFSFGCDFSFLSFFLFFFFPRIEENTRKLSHVKLFESCNGTEIVRFYWEGRMRDGISKI